MSIMMKVFRFGKLIGQCDAKCYNAKTEKCNCVCQGLLHGKGRNEAVRFLRLAKPQYRLMYRSDNDYRIDFF